VETGCRNNGEAAELSKSDPDWRHANRPTANDKRSPELPVF